MNMIREAIGLLRRSKGNRTRTLGVRLFAFFAAFAVALVGVVFLLLYVTGVFHTTEQRHLAWMDAETRHIFNSISNDYSKLSIRGVSFGKALSSDIHNWTVENGIPEKELASHPELLDSLLSEQIGSLTTILDNNVCSGAFIILDASLNPLAENAMDMKSGFFLKRTNTNNLSSVVSKTYCLRGSADTARANGFELLGQWRREFNIAGKDLFSKVIEAARNNSDMELSRLYYWSNRYLMEGNSEHAMLLCVPLIAPDRTVYGLCGMEISDMLFKRLYNPDNTIYPHVFSALSPMDEKGFDTGAGLIAGNSYLTSRTIGLLRGENGSGNLLTWSTDNGNIFTGMTQKVRLYPTGSPFENETWALSLLIPKADWNKTVSQNDFSTYGICFMLLAFSLLAAVFISRRYIRPVVSALEQIKSESRSDLQKTKIAEIDDLLEYLAGLDEERRILGTVNENLTAELEKSKIYAMEQSTSAPAPVIAAYEQFLENLKTLTAAETDVFNLYAENNSAKEIGEKLFITINTVKFHNKNIYAKLGVSSLKELKVYINMMNGT